MARTGFEPGRGDELEPGFIGFFFVFDFVFVFVFNSFSSSSSSSSSWWCWWWWGVIASPSVMEERLWMDDRMVGDDRRSEDCVLVSFACWLFWPSISSSFLWLNQPIPHRLIKNPTNQKYHPTGPSCTVRFLLSLLMSPETSQGAQDKALSVTQLGKRTLAEQK